jgi:hypothetical protein
MKTVKPEGDLETRPKIPATKAASYYYTYPIRFRRWSAHGERTF